MKDSLPLLNEQIPIWPEDGAIVPNISVKSKNTGHESKFPLLKKFKLSLDQNVTEHSFLKLSSRSSKCTVISLNQPFYFVI